jgi:hypothetical protein
VKGLLLALFAVALSGAEPSPPAVRAEDLLVQVVPTKPAYIVGEEVCVDVQVGLRPGTNRVWFMVPRLGLARGPLPEATAGVFLRMALRSETGPATQGSPLELSCRLHAPPDPRDFVWLGPGQFFGSHVCIDGPPWHFRLEKPGKYWLSATVESRTREWVDLSLRTKQIRRKDLSFPPELVLEGSVSAEETEIEVVPAQPRREHDGM